MKKKNLKLGKLNLSKSRVASLDQMQRIIGGSVVGPNCSGACPPESHDCPPDPDPGSKNLPCHTKGFTCGPICDASQRSCDAFLCDNDIFVGLS